MFLSESEQYLNRSPKEKLYKRCIFLESPHFGDYLDPFEQLDRLFEEGKDYKELRDLCNDARNYVDLNNEKEIRKHGSGVLHFIKRCLQIYEDIALVEIAILSIPIVTIPLTLIIFIFNRLERFLWDYIEYSHMEKDARSVLAQLKAVKIKAKQKHRSKEELAKIDEIIERMEENLNN